MKDYKYETIAEDIIQRIKSEEITDKLPTHRELTEHYKVSNRTIAQAIECLKGDGIIYAKPNVGMFVKKQLGG